jgi:hypothetical protein
MGSDLQKIKEMGVVEHVIFSYNLSGRRRYGEDDSYNKTAFKIYNMRKILYQLY